MSALLNLSVPSYGHQLLKMPGTSSSENRGGAPDGVDYTKYIMPLDMLHFVRDFHVSFSSICMSKFMPRVNASADQ